MVMAIEAGVCGGVGSGENREISEAWQWRKMWRKW